MNDDNIFDNDDTQEEIDYYWEKLSAVFKTEQCDGIKDKHDLSWQIVRTVFDEMMQSNIPEKMCERKQ